jgi:ketosteroid isomerase-like protein
MSAHFEAARHAAEAWIDAWNRRDLEAILEHYADEVVFQAPTVVRRWNRPDGRLHGKGELRQHFQLGLERAPNLHFTLEDLLVGPGGYVVLYRRENGNRVADVVELDDIRRGMDVRAYYAGEQE